MESIKFFLKTYQQQLVLTIGYLLVAALAFGLGRITLTQHLAPEIKLEEATTAPDNYTSTVSGIQSQPVVNNTIATQPATGNLNCVGKIKATISSKIYHLPGQSGYDKLNAQTCFDTETTAIAAGFRKALK